MPIYQNELYAKNTTNNVSFYVSTQKLKIFWEMLKGPSKF